VAELKDLLTAADMKVAGRRVTVSFPNDRKHKVSLAEDPESWELVGLVLAPNVVTRPNGGDESVRLDLALRAWRRNQTARLCGFRLDKDGALVGEATVPKIGLTPEELRERVRALARACDLLEAHLTGEDLE
jgi:hypothetical protein